MTSTSADHPLAEAGRHLQITDKEIVVISSEASADWLKLVRRLPDGSTIDELAFGIHDPRLTEIKKEDTNEERLTLALGRWRQMHPSHRWGLLWDTLVECGYGRLANDILTKRLPDEAAAGRGSSPAQKRCGLHEEAPEAPAVAAGSSPAQKRRFWTKAKAPEAPAVAAGSSSAQKRCFWTKAKGQSPGSSQEGVVCVGTEECHEKEMREGCSAQASPGEPPGVDDIPTLSDTFCGRTAIVESVLQRVYTERSNRVITLVGPPGFGKTSIAVAVSKHLQAEGRTRVIFVSLRGITDTRQAISKVMEALLPPTEAHANKKGSLSDLLKNIQRRCVIVLDNAEDCLDASVESGSVTFVSEVKKMIACNDRVKVMITSHVMFQAIDCDAQEVPVTSLDMDDAIKLLRRLRSDISIEHAAEIVSWCGFVPLAVHTAAGVMQHDELTATELIDHFQQSGLTALHPGGRWLNPRQELLIMIESSVKHMSQDSLRAFYGFSLFPGSFSVKAAAAVVNVTNVANLKKDICAELRRRSLLNYDRTSERYSVQPFLSQFAKEKCTPADKEAFHQRFCFYFLHDFLNRSRQCRSCEQLLQLIAFLRSERVSIVSALAYSQDLKTCEIKLLTPLVNGISTNFPCEPGMKFVQLCRAVAESENDVKCQNDCLRAELCILFQRQGWPGIPEVAKAILRNKEKMNMSSVEDLNTLLLAALIEHTDQLRTTFWSLGDPDSSCPCSLHELTRHICTSVFPENGIAEKILCFVSSMAARCSYQNVNVSPERLLAEIMQCVRDTIDPSSSETTSWLQLPSSLSMSAQVSSSKLPLDPNGLSEAAAVGFCMSLMFSAVFVSLLPVPFSSSTDFPETSVLLAINELLGDLYLLGFNLLGFTEPQMLLHMSAFLSTSAGNAIVTDLFTVSLGLPMDKSFSRMSFACSSMALFFINPALRMYFAGIAAELLCDTPGTLQDLERMIACLSKQEVQYVNMLSQEFGLTSPLLCAVIEAALSSSAASTGIYQIIPICSVPFFAAKSETFAVLHRISTNATRSGMSDGDLCKTFELFDPVRCCASCNTDGEDAKLEAGLPCKSCHVVEYCTPSCRRQHKTEHKKWCAQLGILHRDGKICAHHEFQQLATLLKSEE